MHLVSFNPFRTLQIPGVTYLKPEHYLQQRALLETADCLLFPEYWQVNTLYYGLGAHIFPSIASYHLGHNKIEMTRAFEAICPEHVPYTEILANTPEQREAVLDQWAFPFVAKTVKSAQGHGVFLIESRSDWLRYCERHEVLYIQQLLHARRDLRLVVIGSEVIGGYWREHPAGGFHNNISRGGRIIHSALPPAAIELVTRVSQQLNIDHAGFDVMMVNGHPYLLEFNRLFGNRGIAEQGLRIGDAILSYIRERIEPERPRPVGRWQKAG